MRNKYLLYDIVRDRIDAIIITNCSKERVEDIISGHWNDSWGIIEDVLVEHGIGIIWNDKHPFSFTVDDIENTDIEIIDWTTI